MHAKRFNLKHESYSLNNLIKDIFMNPLDLNPRFSDKVLFSIIEQSAVFVCACPAQVCSQLRSQRELYNYQMDCLNKTETDTLVHETIAKALIKTHADLESCLEKILHLEGWDMTTYQMPENIQKRILKSIIP